MRALIPTLVLLLLPAVVHAQQAPGQYYAQPPPPMQVQLTVDEQDLLARGFITDGEHVGGGLAALFLGFGTGQLIQQRWTDRGWIFTFGEIGSLGVMVYGMARAIRCGDGYDASEPCDTPVALMLGGALALGGFRIWEIVDAFVVPPAHNRKVRDLRMRLGLPVPMQVYGLAPYVAPTHGGGGAVGGLTLRF